MNSNSDYISKIIQRAFDTIFLNNPQASTFGILFGWCCQIIATIFENNLLISTGIDISKLTLIEWMVLGVSLFNAHSFLFRKKIPKELEDALILLDKAEKNGLSDPELRQRYRALLQKYVDSVVLRREFEDEIKSLTKQNEEK